MSLDGTIVLGKGRVPNDVMLVGEAPGENEAKQGRPFVGRAGWEQEVYLRHYGLSSTGWYVTNVVKEYREGNPDPVPTQVAEWGAILSQEIEEVRPKLIIAVGRFAAQWFLGDSVRIEALHGIPMGAGAFDTGRTGRAQEAIVLPIYHPAAGFYDNNLRALIDWDYAQVAKVLRQISRGRQVNLPEDPYARYELYEDVGGAELRDEIGLWGETSAIGVDTEGSPDRPWSIQISAHEGTGWVLRRSRSDFRVGILAIQKLIDSGTTLVMHNAMFDVEMCRSMGLDMSEAVLWDSMYAAYIMRTEPQGLKALAYRWCGMKMNTYQETVGDAGLDKQLNYLSEVMGRDWPKPPQRLVVKNDGTFKLYRPRGPGLGAKAILEDIALDKRDKDDNPVDPIARWKKLDRVPRSMVERELGPMPVSTLDDIPLAEAVYYSARDADATIRLYNRLPAALKEKKLDRLMGRGMRVLPIFEEMQSTGMPASRRYFEILAEEMTEHMQRVQSRLSSRFFDGRPFNPASHKQVATLMRRRGIRGSHYTKTGAMSTGKKSIEHLRDQDEAIGLVIDWREHAKVRDSFCAPIMERIPEGVDVDTIHCSLAVTRVHTRRLAARDPNLLAIPIRNELGLRVREGFRCPEGEVFGAWDLSQAEMRIMAHLSGDPVLCRRFREGADIHTETAAEIFGIPVDRVDKMKHRYPAKRAGFGIITNIEAKGLYDQLRMAGCEGWDEESCEKLRSDWLRVYKGVSDYLDACRAEARASGVVYDYWGMPRFLPGVRHDKYARLDAERKASSHKIQGGAQGMIQESMAWLRPHILAMQRQGLNVRWCLQIHDEILLRFDEELWDDLNPLVVDALVNHGGMNLSVPLEADGSKHHTWRGLK